MELSELIADGLAVGVAVGDNVGLLEGLVVGELVGGPVGLADGLAVGDSVICPSAVATTATRTPSARKFMATLLYLFIAFLI